MPTYQRAGLLRETLQTICAQDYAPLEILISDNCSDDETERLCRQIAQADPRVRYVRQPRNIGLHANHNFCIDESRGEFICFFHDDDLYHPQIVALYSAFLKTHPEVGVVCSDWDLIDERGTRIGSRKHTAGPAVSRGIDYIERTIRSGRSSVACSGAMVRRDALGSVRFDEMGPLGFQDFVVWFRVAERSAVGHLGKPLWRYRLHRASLSRRTVRSVARDYRETLSWYCEGYLRRWPGEEARVRRWRRSIDRFLFWALAYEVGLYFRKAGSTMRAGARHRTAFELADYRLSPEEFQHVVEELRTCEGGLGRRMTLWLIEAMVRSRMTWPLAWMTHCTPAVRQLLGLR